MAIWTAGNPVAAAQEGLHVVASPDRGDGARMSWVEMADCSTTVPADVDECQQANDGLEVNFYEYDQDAAPVGDDARFVFHNVATGLSRSTAHSIRLRMFFFEGPDNDLVQVCVDGTTCVTGGSWEDYFRDEEGNPTRPVDSLLFRTGGDANPATAGNGFFIDDVNAAFVHAHGRELQRRCAGSGARGQRRNPERHVHGHAEPGPAVHHDGGLRHGQRHRDRAERLHRGERDADVQSRRYDEDLQRGREGRPDRRVARGLQGQPQQREVGR